MARPLAHPRAPLSDTPRAWWRNFTPSGLEVAAVHLLPVSSGAPAFPSGLEKRAQRVAIERARIPIRIGDGELGGAIQAVEWHADILESSGRAEPSSPSPIL